MIEAARRSSRSVGAAAVAAGLILAPAPVGAGGPSKVPPATLVDEAFVEEVRGHLGREIVALSVRNQNETYADVTRADIARLDEQWRREREAAQKPLIAATLGNPLSSYLTRLQAHSIGLFTEIFVTDERGLNVGQSNITSDYWQGDEAKFQRTFPRGRGAVFVDEPEWHEPSRTWRIQINMSVDDPDGGGAIGAATFEVNLTELARRRNAQ